MNRYDLNDVKTSPGVFNVRKQVVDMNMKGDIIPKTCRAAQQQYVEKLRLYKIIPATDPNSLVVAPLQDSVRVYEGL